MPAGWKITHRERFIYRANSGSPQIQLKIYHYPEYRQKVADEVLPQGFRKKTKGHNRFLVFNGKVAQSGSISLDRTVTVIPEVERISLSEDMGRISEIEIGISRKYREASRYWPLKSDVIRPDEDWFMEDELSAWLRSAWEYLRGHIKPENQDKRWGAEEALKNGVGDCDEFTDSFITLARMRGMPSRRLTGFFIRSEKDFERHAWAEAYSPKLGWVTVDIALNNIGSHTVNYVVLKVEEFNPALSDYSVKINHSSKVHYEWDISEPEIEKIDYEEAIR